jgi:hypothetical protein
MFAAASWRTVSAAPPDAAGEPAGLPEGAALAAAPLGAALAAAPLGAALAAAALGAADAEAPLGAGVGGGVGAYVQTGWALDEQATRTVATRARKTRARRVCMSGWLLRLGNRDRTSSGLNTPPAPPEKDRVRLRTEPGPK